MRPANRQDGRRWIPDSRRRSCHPPLARPLLGYIRVRPETSNIRVEALSRTMAAYAGLEGFVLSRILVDQSLEHTIAFTELLVALEDCEASHVLVPALHHLGHAEGVQLAMKELLESKHQARVLVLFPEQSGGLRG